jgi:hypothetical protein
MGKNWITRQWGKYVETDEPKAVLQPPKINIEEQIFTYPSFTGDTIYLDESRGRYTVPESLNTSDHIFGYRNRGDLTSIQTEGAVITAFHPFKPYG